MENIRKFIIEFLVVVFTSLLLTYISKQYFDFNISDNTYQFIILFLILFLVIIIAIDSYYTSRTKNELLEALKNINSIRYISTSNIKEDPTILTYKEMTNMAINAKKYIYAIGRPPVFKEGNEKLKKKRDATIKKYYSTIENKVKEGVIYMRITVLDDTVDRKKTIEDIFDTNLANHYRNLEKFRQTIFKNDIIKCACITTINCPTFLIIDGNIMLYGIRHLKGKGIKHLSDKNCDVVNMMLQNGIIISDYNGSIIPDFENGFISLFNSSEDIFKIFDFS